MSLKWEGNVIVDREMLLLIGKCYCWRRNTIIVRYKLSIWGKGRRWERNVVVMKEMCLFWGICRCWEVNLVIEIEMSLLRGKCWYKLFPDCFRWPVRGREFPTPLQWWKLQSATRYRSAGEMCFLSRLGRLIGSRPSSCSLCNFSYKSHKSYGQPHFWMYGQHKKLHH